MIRKVVGKTCSSPQLHSTDSSSSRKAVKGPPWCREEANYTRLEDFVWHEPTSWREANEMDDVEVVQGAASDARGRSLSLADDDFAHRQLQAPPENRALLRTVNGWKARVLAAKDAPHASLLALS